MCLVRPRCLCEDGEMAATSVAACARESGRGGRNELHCVCPRLTACVVVSLPVAGCLRCGEREDGGRGLDEGEAAPMATQRRGARVIAADGAARRMRSAMSRARPEHDPRPPEARSPCRARLPTRPLSGPHHGSAPVVPASRLGPCRARITTRHHDSAGQGRAACVPSKGMGLAWTRSLRVQQTATCRQAIL